MGIKDESNINFRGKSLWMLEIKEPEHKHMNSDSIYTYQSMKDNKMENDNRKHIQNKERKHRLQEEQYKNL